MSERLDGWESRLAAVLEAARHRPYVLGKHDCFRLACAAIEALTGEDRWPQFAGYHTRRQAMRRLAAHGRTFQEAGDWFFGAPSVDVRQARRGDIVALKTPDGEKHAGVCNGAESAFLAPEGLLWVPTRSALCCWRVG